MMKNKKRKNHAGFTLIELLVAITILAMIIVPFFHAFVSVVNTNAKSKSVAQATTAAKNVMERIRATSFEGLILNAPEKSEELDGKVTLTYQGSDAIVVNNKRYKAVVTLDPTYDLTVPGDEATEHNRTELANIYDMDSSCDAFYMQPSGLDDEMAERLRYTWKDNVNGTESLESIEEVKKKYKREIIVKIMPDDRVTFDVEYTHVKPTSAAALALGDPEKIQAADPVEYSCAEGKTLRNVYLFFYPVNTVIGAGGWQETITIINEKDYAPVNVYLVKQAVSGVIESGYGVNIKVCENGRADTSMLSAGNANVWTRLCTNLAQTQEEVTYGTVIGAYAPDYNAGSNILSAKDLTGLTDLAAKSAEDRVYKVKVTIYEEGDDTHVLTIMEGTKEK